MLPPTGLDALKQYNPLQNKMTGHLVGLEKIILNILSVVM